MLHTIDPGILFLQQEDQIKAGLLDMKKILAIAEKTYQYLGRGLIHNPPKTHLSIPAEGTWQSFFNTMPCHIAGEVNIAGVKWAAESKKNALTPGIPYGIDISILSDPETVLPFCVLDGTIITAMRTSAVGGLMAKYAAPKGTETVTLIGAGVIGRTMVMAVCEAIPTVKKIYLADLDVAKAEAIASDLSAQYGVEIVPTADSKAASALSQVTITETTARTPFVDESWARPGTAIVAMSNETTQGLVLKADGICADYWAQMKTFPAKALTQLYTAGKVQESDIHDLSEFALGKPFRTSEDQFLYCTSLGLGALDIMVAYELFLSAQKLGLGTPIKMWNQPLWE